MRNVGWRHLPTVRLDSVRACALAAAMTALAGIGHSNSGLAATPAATGILALANSADGTTAADIGSPSAAAGAGTTVAGRTPVEFAVSQSGAATYRIPLWMPPGTGAVELPLELVYNSRGGNGTLGVGWSLTGLSVITRCNKTWAQDGVAGGVANNISDRFCLDGQQLKLVSGTYGVGGSVYATEIEAYSRIVANGTVGSGPASFTLTTKNGLVYDYGTDTESRIHAGTTGTVRTWALARVRDRASGGSGNSIAISYANDAQAGTYSNGSFRVSSITYPTTATGQGPFYTVSFTYSARPASDVLAGYLAGNKVREPNRLDSINIQAIGAAAPIKTYYLGYEVAPTSGRLRLNSVRECAPASCLRPTTIVYQDGAVGWAPGVSNTGVVVAANTPVVPVDLNADGLTDIVYPVALTSTTVSWRMLLASSAGYGVPIDTGFVTATTDNIIPGAFSGNGRMQLLIPRSGQWHVVGIDANGFRANATGLAVNGENGAADFDGDGLDDLMSRLATTPIKIGVRRNVTTPSTLTVASFAASSETAWTIPNLRQSLPSDNLRVADVNGDGRADIVALSFTTGDRNSKSFATPLLSNGFGVPFTVGTETLLSLDSVTSFADWNGDGCTDLIQVTRIYVSNCAGGLVQIATGAIPAGGSQYAAIPTDWNQDGRADLLYIDATTKYWHVVASTGEGAAAAVSTGVKAANSTAWFVLDVDGDGLGDLAHRDGNDGNRLKYQLRTAPAMAADLAVRFTDGFGMQQSPTYVSISRSHYTRGTDAVFPEADFQAPLYVVNQFSATDGTGGTYQNKLHYYAARLHLQGRGFEGFEAQRIEDTRNGLITLDYAHRQFPYTGMHIQRSVYQSDASTRLATWLVTLASQVAGANFERRWFPFAAAITEREYEAGGPLNGALVTESSTTFSYGDGYGNPTQIQKTTTDKDPSSPFLNSAWQSTLTNTFSNDTSAWCLGLPLSSVTTASAPGQSTASRTRAYVPDPTTCRITQQTLEPNNAVLKVTTTFGFDGCGNVSSVRIVGSASTGAALPPRTTSFGYGTRCQLLESATNPVGATTRYANNHDFGVPTEATDPNGLTTRWLHDDFARRTLETRPDQTSTAWQYESCAAGPCWGEGDLRFLKYETQLAADGATIRSLQYFYNGNEQLRYREYHRALGTWTYDVFTYDSLGRLVTEFRPLSGPSNGYTVRGYDLLNRVTARRDFDASAALRSATVISYSGRTTSITDPLGRTRSEVNDVTGQLRTLIEPSPGGTTQYTYDSFGNLARVQDPIGAVSTGRYNTNGFRTQWSDADAGAWSYTPNSLNELVAWSDAKGQVFSATYDAAGRMTTRTEPEGTSTWSWGNSPGARNVGRLKSVSGYGYAENRSYDGQGRLATRAITTDQTYQYDYTYNASGLLDTITYPASPVPAGKSSNRFRIRYGYSYGAPALISDVTESQPRTLWALNATNDYASATSESLASGSVAVAASYDAATNRLTRLQAGSGGTPTNRQDLSYRWDAAGNLEERRDLRQNLSETFTVDALNRVTASAVNGVPDQSVTYDAAGNVKQKSGVGAYVYGDASHPHAVTSAGAISLAYDRNGNLVLRNGATQAWASYNLPSRVAKGGFQSQFAYGPDHRRWRQVASYQNGTETTHYVGGMLEKEHTTSTGLTYWRHYIATPSGLGIVVSRNSDSSSSTSFVLSDHLGSSETVVNEAGLTVSSQSYNAFGARRGSDWRATTAPDWLGIANSTRRGYTSHEMLDNLGLVHMNGRVYDPQLARFLSVDPVVGDLGDSQSANAYAYVGNRPLNATDPTGQFADGGMSIGVVSFIAQTIFNFSSHDNKPPPPPATALPGQSAQNGMGMCGPGTFSPTCGGAVLYAGTPSPRPSGPGTSTWGATSVDDDYASENLDQLFVDLVDNAVDVLILGPINDALEARDAAYRGEFLEAAAMTGLTICGVLKPCGGMASGIRAIKNAKRGVRATTDITVLGHYPEYVRLGEQLGARRFTVPMSVWEKMSPAQQWQANRKFLDRMMSRGGDVVLATPPGAARAGSYFSRELEYLQKRGYKLADKLE